MDEMDWSQKYRPRHFGEVILPRRLEKTLGQLVNQKGGLSVLFYGKPGCGKTTVAKLINPENTYYVNCTNDNSIDTIRELARACTSLTLNGDRRLVLLDEADYLSRDAQAALRGTVETLSSANDFVMTANEPSKLSDAMRSRFLPICFDFDHDPTLRDRLRERLLGIANAEGYTRATVEQLNDIVDYAFPDTRKMLKSLQFHMQLSHNRS